MIGTRDLSQKSICQTLLQLQKRALIAAPFHIALFLFMICWIEELRANSVSWWFFSVIVAAGFARLIQNIWGEKLLRVVEPSPAPPTAVPTARITTWRILFSIHTWALGAAWGFNCGYSVYHLGLTSPVITVFALTSCIAAASVPAFSFDLVIQFIFQSFMFMPTMISAWTIPDPNGVALGVGFLFFLAFMWYAGISLFRFQVGVLKASEIVEKQKLDLQVSHENLSVAHETIETMLESIDEAFLSFDREGRCSTTSSVKSQEILGINPSGLFIQDILAVKPEERTAIARWFNLLFLRPEHFSNLVELGMKTMTRKSDSHQIRLTFHPVRNANDELKSVILTAIDIQQEVVARKQALVAAERAELILRIHDNRAGFQNLLTRYEIVLNEICDRKFSTQDVKRELHTMKGAFAIFGAVDFSRKVHECETLIKKSDENGQRSAALNLRNEFLNWKKANTALFAQLGIYADEVIELSRRKLNAVQAEFMQNPEQMKVAEIFASRLISVDFGDVLEDFRAHLSATAAKLGKQISFEVERPVNPIYVDSKSREMLRTFIHLFNNALDHGIESPSDRISRGKSAQGTIKVSYDHETSYQRKWIRLLISDDGSGINVDKIRTTSGASEGKLTDLEVAERIFEDAFTTRQNVSEISGQGVGMGAVRAAIQKYGGQIKILATSIEGTTFEVLLPSNVA